MSNEDIEIFVFIIQTSRSQLINLQQEVSSANIHELDYAIQKIINLMD
jgi:hypothetical protein